MTSGVSKIPTRDLSGMERLVGDMQAQVFIITLLREWAEMELNEEHADFSTFSGKRIRTHFISQSSDNQMFDLIHPRLPKYYIRLQTAQEIRG